MPSLVPELALCFHIFQRKSNVHCIDLEHKKANKQQIESKAGLTADLLAHRFKHNIYLVSYSYYGAFDLVKYHTL